MSLEMNSSESVMELIKEEPVIKKMKQDEVVSEQSETTANLTDLTTVVRKTKLNVEKADVDRELNDESTMNCIISVLEKPELSLIGNLSSQPVDALKNEKNLTDGSTSKNSNRQEKKRRKKKTKAIIFNSKSRSNLDNKNDYHKICRICHQKLDDNVKYYNDELDQNVEEDEAIIQAGLSLFNGNEKEVAKEDARAYNKLTSFTVYCENGHLCSLDSGLIETDVEVYFSGYIKPIYCEDASIKDGIPVKNCGPIVLWWITGFDIGEKPRVAFSTEIGDYLLMEPSKDYAPLMLSALNKIQISKIVIEYLIYEPNASYEDLLIKLDSTSTSENPEGLTENILLDHAQFVCNQVMSFDDTAKPDEPLLVTAPCMRRLIDLAGIQLIKPSRRKKKSPESQGNNYQDQLRKVFDDQKDKTSNVLDQFIPVSLYSDIDDKQNKRRCSKCERCRRPACGTCDGCLHKNQNECHQRRCFYQEIKQANEEDLRDKIDVTQLIGQDSFNAFENKIKSFNNYEKDVIWPEVSMAKESSRIYYNSVTIDGVTIRSGDFVSLQSINSNVSTQIVKIIYLFNQSSGAAFHANYFWRGEDTILNKAAYKNELFFIEKCSDIPVSAITEKILVDVQQIPTNWLKAISRATRNKSPPHQFYCEKSYDPKTGRFQNLPSEENISRIASSQREKAYRFCWICESLNRQIETNTPQVLKEHVENERILCDSISYKNEMYEPGMYVYLKPKTLYFKYPMQNYYGKSFDSMTQTIDKDKYPEYYRKLSRSFIDNKAETPAPYDIAYIKEIFKIEKNIYMKAYKLYRPENTHNGEANNKKLNLNLLFWSEEETTISFTFVIRRCFVCYKKCIPMNVDDWTSMGPDRFFFDQVYSNGTFYNVDKKLSNFQNAVQQQNLIDYPKIEKLKAFDIFSGCGGLSLGLREAGLIESRWAVEPVLLSAMTYKRNSPNTQVFNEDCQELLDKLIKGKTKIDNKQLPQKGDVDILCGTLPWENYKNSVNAFRKSTIVTFLNYCLYYRPHYFILETDEKLMKSILFKMTVAVLIKLGFQIAFDLMQVGSFGAPQNRKRTVLLGSSPFRVLPKFPQHLHVFPKSFCKTNLVIQDKKYMPKNDQEESAPYRTITIHDALSDLTLKNFIGQNTKKMSYSSIPECHFQKKTRKNMTEPVLYNHVYKDFGPLVESRIAHIPKATGSDWRNIPNIEIQLKDGTVTEKIVYKYFNKATGTPGVCSCSVGNECDLRDRQQNTLIPWYLIHSADQNANWPGVYSRLQWDGFLEGVITTPEPLGGERPVLHPSESRVVSVRECARAYGFDDSFVLENDDTIDIRIYEMYRQLSQSASPLLALAIGREFVKSIALHNY